MNETEIEKALVAKIEKLRTWEEELQGTKDYMTCLYLHGAIIYFLQFLREIEKEKK